MRPPLLLLAFCLLLVGGCSKPRDPLVDLQEFFKQIAAGKTQEAYESSAFGFQSQRTAEAFGQATQEMGLVGAMNVSWDAPHRDGREVKVRVVIKTKTGQDLPLIVTMLDEKGAWRVFALRVPPDALPEVQGNRLALNGTPPHLTASTHPDLPYEPELQTLTRDTLLQFNDAVIQKAFDAFFETVSLRWQQELIDPELFEQTHKDAVDPNRIEPEWTKHTAAEKSRGAARMQRAFQPFIDRQLNISPISTLQATFETPPAINSDGMLILTGSYPTQPYQVHFKLTFLYEAPNWRLFGLDVDLRK